MRWLYLVPTLIINVAVIFIPALMTVDSHSFAGTGYRRLSFVGLGNFRSLAADRTFWTALGNNVVWTVIFLVVPIGMGLLAATMLLIIRRGSNFFQVVYFLPVVIATTITARIWQGMIYSPVSGVLGLLDRLGLTIPNPLARLRPLFMGSPRSIFGTGGASSAWSSSQR